MKNLGQQVRRVREIKEISLTDYANHLGVSAGYLSNLETGKTETIQLSLLDRLCQELNLSLTPNQTDGEEDLDLETRFQRIHRLLLLLKNESPEAAEYLLTTFEKGIELFLSRQYQ